MCEYVVILSPEGSCEEYIGATETLEEARELARSAPLGTPEHLYGTARAAGRNVPGCSAPPDWYSKNIEACEWVYWYAIVRRPE